MSGTEWVVYPVAGVFTLLGLACALIVPVGLPGTWILLGLAVVVELADGLWLGDPASTFGWWLLGGCVGLALLGEVIETATGAVGTKLGGGSKRGMWGAVLGGFLGAFLLTLLVPIPVVGTLAGALLGTFAGALLGERSRGDREDPSLKADLKAATGATIGRVLGTMAKSAIAFSIWVGLAVAAFWP